MNKFFSKVIKQILNNLIIISIILLKNALDIDYQSIKYYFLLIF